MKWSEHYTFFITLLASFLVFYLSVDSMIDKKLDDPRFIEQVVEKARTPFMLFDENYQILYESPGMDKFIDKINIIEKGRDLSEIVVTPKHYLSIPPILESFNQKIIFQEPIRGERYDFIYKRVMPQVAFSDTYSTPLPPNKFRLQVINVE
jgi:hypothetical protein